MATSYYTITDTAPIAVYPAGQQASILVRNTSLINHVLLANVANGQGFDLGPGSAMTWDAGNPLYLSAVLAGTSTVIVILDNGGNLFDASAIAGQIQISGAPPIDTQKVLYEATSAPGGVIKTPYIDASPYQSLIITVRNNTGAGAATPQDYATCRLGWYFEPLVTDVMAHDEFVAMDTNNDTPAGYGFTTYVSPVRAPFLVLDLVSPSGNTGVTVKVVGSYKTAPDTHYMQQSNYNGAAQFGLSPIVNAGNLAHYAGSKSAGTAIFYPNVKSGPCVLSCTALSVTTAISVAVVIGTTTVARLLLPVLATPQSASLPLILPNYPIWLLIVGAGGTVTVSLALNP